MVKLVATCNSTDDSTLPQPFGFASRARDGGRADGLAVSLVDEDPDMDPDAFDLI